jgi:hypothetical protein
MCNRATSVIGAHAAGAASEGVRRVVVTSSVAGIAPAAPARQGHEDDLYRGGGLGLTGVGRRPVVGK